MEGEWKNGRENRANATNATTQHYATLYTNPKHHTHTQKTL